MKFSKASLCCVALIASIAVIIFVSPATAEEWGIDFWRMGELEQQIARCETRRLEMERVDQVIVGRTALRHGIIRNLCSKQISLEEAASGFLTLNQTEPSSIKYLQLTHPNRSDYELSVIQVMMHIKNMYGRESETFERLSYEAICVCGPDFE
jgi:hypothetical protein